MAMDVATMTSRERVLAAFAHEEPDHVPAWFGAAPETRELMIDQLGLADDEALSVFLGDDFRRVYATYAGPPEFGPDAAQDVLNNLTPYLEQIGNGPSIRWLKGLVAFNRAFRDYRNGLYANVPSNVLRAILNDPTYLTNRGLMAVLAGSIVRLGW